MEGSKAEKKREPVSRIVVEAGCAQGSEALLELAGRAGVPVALRGEWEVAVSRDTLHNATLAKLRLDPGPALPGEVVIGGKGKSRLAPGELERRLLWQLVERLEREVAELKTVTMRVQGTEGGFTVAVEAARGDGTVVPVEGFEPPVASPFPAAYPEPSELAKVDPSPQAPPAPFVRVGDVWVSRSGDRLRVDEVKEMGLDGLCLVERGEDGDPAQWVSVAKLAPLDWKLDPSHLEVGDRVRLLPLEGKPPEGVTNNNPALYGRVGRIDYEVDGTVHVVDVDEPASWSCWWDAKRVERLPPEEEKAPPAAPRVEVGSRVRIVHADGYPEACWGGRGTVDHVDPTRGVAHLQDLADCGNQRGVWWPLDKLVVLS